MSATEVNKVSATVAKQKNNSEEARRVGRDIRKMSQQAR